MQNVIELSNVTKSFGSLVAVSNLSLTVPKGQVLGFLGPNGAGKTTTMRMITGYYAPSSGTIRIMGEKMAEHSTQAKMHIGYLPEGAPLYHDVSPRMLLKFISQARGMSPTKSKERFDFVVSTLHLNEILDQPIETLSKGFKRRVGLAQAIFHDPDILILDEPTDGLDPIQKHEVRQLIRSMGQHKAIIISTHILEEVEAVCDRAVVISKGSIVADDTPKGLTQRHSDYQAIALTIEHPHVSEIIAILQNCLDVTTVTLAISLEATHHLIVHSDNPPQTLQELIRLTQTHAWNLQSLTMLEGKLDDVFRELVAA